MDVTSTAIQRQMNTAVANNVIRNGFRTKPDPPDHDNEQQIRVSQRARHALDVDDAEALEHEERGVMGAPDDRAPRRPVPGGAQEDHERVARRGIFGPEPTGKPPVIPEPGDQRPSPPELPDRIGDVRPTKVLFQLESEQARVSSGSTTSLARTPSSPCSMSFR